MKVYRGTKNLSPSKLIEFYAVEGEYGRGMYFTPSEQVAKVFSQPMEGFGIVAHYQLLLDGIAVFEHDSPLNEQIEKLKLEIKLILEKIFHRDFENLEDEGFDLDSEEPLVNSENSSQESSILQVQELHGKYLQFKRSLNHLIKSYVVEKTPDGYAVIVREDFVPFILKSIDLNLLVEDKAASLFEKLKIGELDGTWIKNIDSSLIDLVERTLKEQ